ncbi:MAG: Serine-tRNA ligase [Candidatus Woesebacteria bacterium GW2011_GWA1_33_30]|uniref:Serine--tRNA ligase n=1 Tax=Candidatus Woesebacteria bacterium GW2011_GWA2_33_28 TaxID=1618561 RepID=A0A0F9ZVG5_9BACT|nr:MAG: Serine-tRNA ligase [Candidatus Woesebacteria bacterium GW2011_GWA2_33_28]KKP48981.1 MAG: Serine-tRNA ligase [Candidatus Woesebacteria bacterium GW2011_GWA1_33_30]KKP49911.1 MAG: Serine-tRNA ligase [Microgenomates group bacterium GW2011_GWC1_33_32]KKP52573.1 MAG: Serine-tRNA ligase [Candidatus Woesebacteria bacterium GW2011_GWB1_33_38]KKP55992.1 MAG: Serine-tRNA ligase [Microgenomates group bacterium GW2011_GWD1_33_9]
MLDIKFIRENIDLVKQAVKNKQLDSSIVDNVLKVDEEKRKLIQEVEELRGLKNKYATEKNIEKGKETKLKLQELEPRLSEVEKEFLATIYKIPNIVSNDTPIGKDESENKVIRSWGRPKEFKFTPKDHLELGIKLGIINCELAGRVTGTRFTYLFGDAVLLQNALYQFALSVLLKKGFVPVLPPLFINPNVYTKMARLSPETEIERYAIERDNQYLIGSAEHTLGPIHMDTTFNEKDLPLRYFAFTPAFRREAGSYGKDTKGILRQHQFDKLEMESFSTPEQGLAEQDLFVSIQEELMQALEIPYQVVAICTGDMGGPDFRQMDIESWMPGQGKYRETHTSDYMTDYQSRRLNTRVRTKNGTEFVHMNDATAFAMGRTIIAILENYQNEDGSINIPSVLQKWMGKSKIQNK